MSFLGKKWIIKNETKDKGTIEKVLDNRKVADINDGMIFHDPFLLEDMEKAVARIKKAIEKQDRIIVFGDYDVDGISGAAIMIITLKKLGANVSYRLPHRVNDGYGLSEKFIDEFIEKQINLVITVDCGISCVREIQKAKDHNIDVIITDHHAVPEHLPNAVAILHPRLPNSKYPFKELTGAGMALKLAQALLGPSNDNEFFEELIALASLGTVADLGILQGENRLIVKKGLKNLLNTKSGGLKKLVELAELKDQNMIDAYTISFRIAPRINAAGRIGDPYLALSLLLQDEGSKKVHALGQKLEDLNVERQNKTEKATKEAEAFFTNQTELPYILVSEHKDWHVGILGLVAAKLVEKYNRPAIIMQDFGDTLVASARSPRFFNITEALAELKEYLVSFGGHAQAAGFSLKKENLEKFKEA
ncbi:MAG: single-stranded-DNA-specific exonuclease RecJ, partial [Candidatus Gracilibacteria bacterium]